MTLTVAAPLDITSWTRLEPHPRSNDFLTSLRAEIRDPVWLLTRQRQMGEFKGEDAGSPAYTRVTVQNAPFTKWAYRKGLHSDGPLIETEFDPGRPLEAQALVEPHIADLMTQIELGQIFFDLLEGALSDPTARDTIKSRFRDPAIAPFAQFTPMPSPVFDPHDRATTQFLGIAQTPTAVNGFGIYEEAKKMRAPDGAFPVGLADDQNEEGAIREAFDRLVDWVESTYGEIRGNATDPPAWDPRRLEYRFTVSAGNEAQATLLPVPDQDATFSWPSFDFAGQTGDPFNSAETKTEIPSYVRFRGMPAPRFWDFESGEFSIPDVRIQTVELAKLVLLDVLVIYGIDWFTIPVDVPSGSIVRVQELVVRDVFGRDTNISPADEPTQPAGLDRWTMYSPGSPGAGLASFRVLPPAAGRTMQSGPVLEEVRFARDEAANLVWGIETTTQNPIGQPRSGNTRDAAVDALIPPVRPRAEVTAPLRYQIESKIPVHWIPFLAVPVGTDPLDPKIELEKAAVARPDPADVSRIALVPSTATILNPDKLKPDTPGSMLGGEPRVYRLPEEEVPRAGLRVQRVIHRSRWVDGSTHVWVARRKLVGAGETQSGLRFDAAIPSQK